MKICARHSDKPPTQVDDVDSFTLRVGDTVYEVRTSSVGTIQLCMVNPISGILTLTPGGTNTIHVDVVTAFPRKR